jgi:hypothetical protein
MIPVAICTLVPLAAAVSVAVNGNEDAQRILCDRYEVDRQSTTTTVRTETEHKATNGVPV